MEGKIDKILQELKKLDDLTAKVDQFNDKFVKLEEKVKHLEEVNIKLEKRLCNIENRQDSSENQSRSNLIFKGLKESDSEESWDDVKKLVIATVKKELKLVIKSEDIERAHRLNTRYRPRPVIVKLHHFAVKEKILSAKSNINKNSNLSITEDYSKKVRLERSKLFVKMKEARDKEIYASLRYNKLVIDKTWYVYDWGRDEVVKLKRRRNNARQTDEDVVDSEDREGEGEEPTDEDVDERSQDDPKSDESKRREKNAGGNRQGRAESASRTRGGARNRDRK